MHLLCAGIASSLKHATGVYWDQRERDCPWALRKLMEKMRNRKSSGPLLITTHSPTVVDCITDPGNLFIVDNSIDDGTTVTRATCKEEALKIVMTESGQQLGQIWLDGTLGGVPGE